MKVILIICTLALVIRNSTLLIAQQPQVPAGAPIYAVNAKYVNGLAPGYWPAAGSGLTLTLSSGTAYCGNPPSPVSYAGGTLAMNPSATNYVYLNPAANCAPAVNAAGFAVGHIPIAKVLTGASAITGVTDLRTWSSPNPAAMSSSGAVQIAALGTNQKIALLPSGTGVTQITNLVDNGGQVYNVKAYGATGNGTTDDTAAIQSAIAAIRVATGTSVGNGAKYNAVGTIYFPPGTYRVSQLDLTDTKSLKIVGSGTQSTIIKCSESSAGSGVCLDMSGSSHAVVEDILIIDDTNGPKVELLIGKTAQNPDGNYNYFRIAMAPTTATYGLYDYGSEDTTFVAPVFWSTGAAIPVVISSLNSLGVSSPFTALASGSQSMSTVTFIGGRIVSAGAQCVLIDDWNGTDFKPPAQIRWYGTFFGLTGTSTIGIEDNSTGATVYTIPNVEVHSRFEMDHSGNQAIKINQNAQNWILDVAYGYSGTLSGYPFEFIGHYINGIALVNPNDTGSAHPGGAFHAHSTEGSWIAGTNTIDSVTGSAGSVNTQGGKAYMSKYYLPGNANQTITGGNGAPSGGCQSGSMYLDASGGAGTTLYVCETGAWVAK